jgi:hypothetical protein
MEKTDLAVSLGKGILGAIPIVGPLMAEIVGHVIPNQRLDRLERFLRILETKVGDVEHSKLKERFAKEEFVDLLEDGMLHASRALSDERKAYIASIIEAGIKEDEFEAIQKKLILNLLSELNDTEVITLQSYGIHPQNREEYFEKHRNVLTPPMATLGSTPEVIDDKAIYDAQKNHLERLGLLRLRFKKPRKGELPEFDDKTGMVKAQGYAITSLGRLLLRNIGLQTWP